MEKVATTGLKDASFQYNDIYEGIVKELPQGQDLTKIAEALRNASDIMKAAVREVEVKGFTYQQYVLLSPFFMSTIRVNLSPTQRLSRKYRLIKNCTKLSV